MEIKLDFDTRKFNKNIKGVNRATNHAIKFVIDAVAFDLKENFKKTAKKTDIVSEGNALRPYTARAARFKRSTLKNLTAHVFLNSKASSSGVSQYDYLKYTIDKGRHKIKTPKRANLISPDKTYNRAKSYGQAQKRGGVVKKGDFWLKNKSGGLTLFNRKDGELNAIWHTSKFFNYKKSTLPYYADMFKLIKRKKKHYTKKLFARSMQYNIKKLTNLYTIYSIHIY